MVDVDHSYRIPLDPFRIPLDPYRIPVDPFRIPLDPFRIPLDHDASSYHDNHDAYDVARIQNHRMVVVDIPSFHGDDHDDHVAIIPLGPLDHDRIHQMVVVDIPSFHGDDHDHGDHGDHDDHDDGVAIIPLGPLDHDQIHRMVVVVDIPFHDDHVSIIPLGPLDHDQIHRMVVVVVDIPSFHDAWSGGHGETIIPLDPLDHGRIHQSMDHASDDDDHVGSHGQIFYQIYLNYWNL
ncbi:hypothetical protein U3516DRAFT_893003, partial [Neocallimastix sp. 'constans']